MLARALLAALALLAFDLVFDWGVMSAIGNVAAGLFAPLQGLFQ